MLGNYAQQGVTRAVSAERELGRAPVFDSIVPPWRQKG